MDVTAHFLASVVKKVKWYNVIILLPSASSYSHNSYLQECIWKHTFIYNTIPFRLTLLLPDLECCLRFKSHKLKG